MKAYRRCSLFLVAGALMLGGCGPGVEPQQQQAPQPETRAETALPTSAPMPTTISPAISLNVLMVKFVDQAADPIWEAAVNPPKTAQEWEQVEYHATQLATTGTLMEVGGTGPMDAVWVHSPGWTEFTQRMTQASLAAVAAAKNKDVEAITKAGDEIVLNCEGCHRAFKLDLPTEGLATHLARGLFPEK